MTYTVVFDPAAEADLDEIAIWVAERANLEVAIGYVDRLVAFCQRLDVFPKRGTSRDDLLSGLRTIGFERRVLIAFRVQGDTVSILRILYGGQDSERVLAELA